MGGSTGQPGPHPCPTSSPVTRARGRRATYASGSTPTSPTASPTPSRTGPPSRSATRPAVAAALIRHLTSQGATIDELEQAGLISLRERNDGTTYYTDFFKDRLVMPIRDPHDPAGRAGDPRLRRPSQPHQDRRRLRRPEVPQHPHHPYLHQGRSALRVRRYP